MRLKRQKQYKRHMHVYQTSYGFRTPYQVLLDGNFIQAGLDTRTHIQEGLAKVLLASVKPMVTACTVAELRSLGEDASGAVLAARRYERRRCTHSPPVSSAECLASIISTNNPHNYCVATQSPDLRDQLRQVPGVPLLYISRSVLVLEPPSEATHVKAAELERKKTMPSDKELAFLRASREKPDPTAVQEAKSDRPKKRKRKGPKGPNPLSVKKKKKPNPEVNGMSQKKAETNGAS